MAISLQILVFNVACRVFADLRHNHRHLYRWNSVNGPSTTTNYFITTTVSFSCCITNFSDKNIGAIKYVYISMTSVCMCCWCPVCILTLQGPGVKIGMCDWWSGLIRHNQPGLRQIVQSLLVCQLGGVGTRRALSICWQGPGISGPYPGWLGRRLWRYLLRNLIE